MVIVTGGGTGVGAATSLDLAKRGYNVMIGFGSRLQPAEETAGKCRALGAEVDILQMDVGKDEGCRALVAATVKRWGRLDGLVNNAGTTSFVRLGDFEKQGADDFHRIYTVNVIGPYQMARAAEPYLRKSDRASVVNVSSSSSKTGLGSSIGYAASKGALNTLTLALAQALGPEIRVNAVLPGFIEGDWLREGLGAERYDANLHEYKARGLLRRACKPEEVAAVIAWLIAESPIVTGELIAVDSGGYLGRMRSGLKV